MPSGKLKCGGIEAKWVSAAVAKDMMPPQQEAMTTGAIEGCNARLR
jgi:hypothetical protein